MQIVAYSSPKSWLFKNKRILILVVLLFLFLFGAYCTSSLPPSKGDFTFDLPESYSVSEITDKNCSVVDANGTVIGGIILTDLRVKNTRNLDSCAFDTPL